MTRTSLIPRWLASSVAVCVFLAACGDGGDDAAADADAVPTGSAPAVTDPNAAPQISGAPPTSATQGQPYAFTPSATDADNDPLTFSISNRPSWAVFNASTGKIDGMPTDGTFTNIVISVSDGQGTAWLAPFNITVQPGSNPPVVSGNRAPVISGTPQAAAMASQSYAFTPSSSDPDGDTLTFTVGNLPGWASFNAATGRISGTPTSVHVGAYNNIAISVSDGQTSASLPSFGITVTAVATGSVTLSWTPPTGNSDGSPLTNFAGYRIYWSQSQPDFPNSVTVNNPGLASYVVEQLPPATWYFVVTAINSLGTESPFSNVASRTIQ
jgi:hypothetical protein